MKGATKCLSSASSALVRVFMSRPLQPSIAPSQLQHLLLPAVYTVQPANLFSGSSHLGRPIVPNGRGGKPIKISRFPRDYEITHKLVVIRDDNGRLSEPRRTRDVLADLDLQVYSLIVIALPESESKNKRKKGKEHEDEDGDEAADEEDAKKARSRPQYPICRIVDKKAEHKAAMEKAKTERKKTVGTKEMEINWAIAPHDLQTKLRQMKGFLSKGLRAQVLLLNKSKGRTKRATRDEAKEVLKEVKEAIDAVPGCKEYKSMEGAVGGQVRLFIEGPRSEAS